MEENPLENVTKDKKTLTIVAIGGGLIVLYLLVKGRSESAGYSADSVSGAVLADQTRQQLEEQKTQTEGAIFALQAQIGSALEQVSESQRKQNEEIAKQREADSARITALGSSLASSLNANIESLSKAFSGALTQQQEQTTRQITSLADSVSRSLASQQSQYGEIVNQVNRSNQSLADSIASLTRNFQSQLESISRVSQPVYTPPPAPQIQYTPAPMVYNPPPPPPPPQVQAVVTMTPPTTRTYTVVRGDNLSTIAARNGISLATLLQKNPQFQANPNLIHAGNVVYL